MFFSSDTTKTDTAQKKLQIHFTMKIAKIMNRILSIAYNNLTKAQSDIIRQINHLHYVENFVIKNEIMINTQNFVSN